MVRSEYLSEVFDPSKYPEVIRKVRMKLRNTNYDAIAFRGISGAAVAFPLAALTGKSLICARKIGTSHSKYETEGFILDGGRYVIVDDFISSGDTLSKIKKNVEEVHKEYIKKIPKCVAIVFYKEYNPDVAAAKARRIFPKTKVHVIDYLEYEN